MKIGESGWFCYFTQVQILRKYSIFQVFDLVILFIRAKCFIQSFLDFINQVLKTMYELNNETLYQYTSNINSRL